MSYIIVGANQSIPAVSNNATTTMIASSDIIPDIDQHAAKNAEPGDKLQFAFLFQQDAVIDDNSNDALVAWKAMNKTGRIAWLQNQYETIKAAMQSVLDTGLSDMLDALAQEAPLCIITGTVTDDGDPAVAISGATVEVFDLNFELLGSAVTAVDGTYTIPSMPAPEDITVVINKTGKVEARTDTATIENTNHTQETLTVNAVMTAV